jgi:adenylate cyclase class 2
MNYEVERKFRLDDAAAFIQRAVALGAVFGAPIRQVDQYFAHPSRQFARTDEALRVRVTDGQCRITYKGPKLSAQTKTRREIELPFAESVKDPQPIVELLLALDFRSVATVLKSRRSARIVRSSWEFSMDVDDVQGVGSFVELDTSASEDQVADAECAMAGIVAEFGLHDDVRTSYLEMLLAAPGR